MLASVAKPRPAAGCALSVILRMSIMLVFAASVVQRDPKSLPLPLPLEVPVEMQQQTIGPKASPVENLNDPMAAMVVTSARLLHKLQPHLGLHLPLCPTANGLVLCARLTIGPRLCDVQCVPLLGILIQQLLALNTTHSLRVVGKVM